MFLMGSKREREGLREYCLSDNNSRYFQSQPSWFPDINEWWRGDGTCANSGWRPGTNIAEEAEEDVDRAVEEKENPKSHGWSYHEPKSSRDRARILMGGS